MPKDVKVMLRVESTLKRQENLPKMLWGALVLPNESQSPPSPLSKIFEAKLRGQETRKAKNIYKPRVWEHFVNDDVASHGVFSFPHLSSNQCKQGDKNKEVSAINCYKSE